MAQFKDLIVNGVARVLDKVYASEFVGKLTGNADTATTATTLQGLTSTVTELNYVDGVTSNIQTQLNGKAASSHGTHVPSSCTTITDWNNATTTGWYMASGASNAPSTSGWYMGYVVAHNTNYVYQEVYQFTASTDAKLIPKYIRAKMNGTWGSWTDVSVQKAVPSDAVFTDNNTTYSAATTSANGLMTSAMVTKLNSITDSADSVSFAQSLTSGTKVGTITINGTATDLYCQTNTNTDTKVKQTVTTTDASYPLLLAPSGQTATTTTSSYFDSGVTLNPSTNTITANITGSSASCTGNAATATTATKLGSSTVGSATQPIYLSSGTATKCTYTLGKSVPSDAVFTDTTYSTMGAATSSAAGTSGLVPAPAAGAQAKYLRGDGTWATPTNTKNTAGSTDSSSKLFLIGATSQASSATTYSHDTAYVGTDGCLYSNSTKVSVEGHTHTDISVYTISGLSVWSATEKYLTIESVVRFQGSSFAPDNGYTECDLGASGYEWDNVYANTFHGELDGNASTATALTTSAGSSTTPVYFSDGKPVACSYTLGAACARSVTSTASSGNTSLITSGGVYSALANHTHTYARMTKVVNSGSTTEGVVFHQRRRRDADRGDEGEKLFGKRFIAFSRQGEGKTLAVEETEGQVGEDFHLAVPHLVEVLIKLAQVTVISRQTLYNRGRDICFSVK